MSISSIVIADDGSAHAVAALDLAIELALKFEARLTIVHVYTHDHPPAELRHLVEVEHLAGTVRSEETHTSVLAVAKDNIGEEEPLPEERLIAVLAEQIINNAVSKAKESNVKDVSSETRSGDYANSILEVAREKNADMIVMGRRGLSNLKGLIFGSVSQKVSQRADCSVLTVK